MTEQRGASAAQRPNERKGKNIPQNVMTMAALKRASNLQCALTLSSNVMTGLPSVFVTPFQ
jgi:hypothetical protein